MAQTVFSQYRTVADYFVLSFQEEIEFLTHRPPRISPYSRMVSIPCVRSNSRIGWKLTRCSISWLEIFICTFLIKKLIPVNIYIFNSCIICPYFQTLTLLWDPMFISSKNPLLDSSNLRHFCLCPCLSMSVSIWSSALSSHYPTIIPPVFVFLFVFVFARVCLQT